MVGDYIMATKLFVKSEGSWVEIAGAYQKDADIWAQTNLIGYLLENSSWSQTEVNTFIKENDVWVQQTNSGYLREGGPWLSVALDEIFTQGTHYVQGVL